MDWVKLMTGYYRDIAIAVGSDAAEVMFTRGCALAGEIEQSGFIPDAMVPSLTRKPVNARKVAAELVAKGLWERVRGGYQIVNWESIQAELERIVAKKARDRDRKRAERENARRAAESGGSVAHNAAPSSVDASADSPTDSHEDRLSGESKSKRTTAAARPGKPKPKTLDLPPAVEILRAALEAHKLFVKWNRLTAEQLTEIEDLVGRHGDRALVQAALRAYQPDKPAVYAQAWLEDWRILRRPGDLAVVPDEPCPEPGHAYSGGTTRRCNACIAESHATPKEQKR